MAKSKKAKEQDEAVQAESNGGPDRPPVNSPVGTNAYVASKLNEDKDEKEDTKKNTAASESGD